MGRGCGRSRAMTDRPVPVAKSEGAAYDPDRRNVLIVTCCLFVDSSLATSAWAWDGHALHVLSPSQPLVGGPFFMVPDGHDHVLAFGKDSSSSWDGKNWSSLASPANLPSDAWSVASDPAHQQTFAIGRGTLFRMWQWQEGTWNLEPTASSVSGPPGGARSESCLRSAATGLRCHGATRRIWRFPQSALGNCVRAMAPAFG
jgi:hypothetical protein